jgi:hypothetical protein
MRVHKVSGREDSECPAVYVSDRGTAVVQGDHVTAAEGLKLGSGETAVELPPEIVLGAMTALAGECGDGEVVRRLKEALGCS